MGLSILLCMDTRRTESLLTKVLRLYVCCDESRYSSASAVLQRPFGLPLFYVIEYLRNFGPAFIPRAIRSFPVTKGFASVLRNFP